MEKKLLALSLAQYLVINDFVVFVSCSHFVDVSVHLDSSDVTRLQKILEQIRRIYRFNYSLNPMYGNNYSFVCHCTFGVNF